MAHWHLQYRSRPLNQQMSLHVFVPDFHDAEHDSGSTGNTVAEAQEKSWPTIYQLHGLSDGAASWQRLSNIERYAQAAGMMVVCPDGGRSFYCNTPYGAWEDHLLDVIRYCDEVLPTLPQRWARGIGGLSMGGYGALKMALKHPHLFGSVVAHSGVLDLARSIAAERFVDLPFLFPGGLAENDDILQLAQAANPASLPAIAIDCGVDDFLLDHNRDVHRLFDGLQIDHRYEEPAGAHEWSYWDRQVQSALAFHAEHLKFQIS